MKLLGGPPPVLLDRLQAVSQLIQTLHRDLQLLLVHACLSGTRPGEWPATAVFPWWTNIAPLFSQEGDHPSHHLSAGLSPGGAAASRSVRSSAVAAGSRSRTSMEI